MSTAGNDTYAGNTEFWVQMIRGRMDRYRTDLTDPAILGATGQVEGRRVLDGGCGEGYLSRELTRRGAIVTGLDRSPSLITAAVGERDRLGLTIDHYTACLESIPEPDETFDLVVCNHVMNDVEDPVPVLKELGRVTKSGGRLVILMLHPCFYVAEAEREISKQIPAVEYFGDRNIGAQLRVTGIESAAQVHMTLYPLSHYMRAITDGGFVITGITEPHPSPEQMDTAWWQENFLIPLFMLVSAQRVAD